MPACAVAGNEQSCGVSAIEGGMFHNVGYCAVNVFYDLVHLHRHARPVAISDESVVNAEHYKFPCHCKLAPHAPHDVLGVGTPASAVHNDDARKVFGFLWSEHVVFQSLISRAGVDNIIRDADF